MAELTADDAWGGWAGERRLWATLGTSSIPVTLAILALRPTVVAPVISPQSVDVLGTIKDVLRTVDGEPLRWDPPVIVPPDDPAEIARVLGAHRPEPGHLAFSGGTAAMSAIVYHDWKQRHGGLAGSRAWYLADREGQLRSEDVVLELSGLGPADSSLPELLRLRGLDRSVRSQATVRITAADVLSATDVSWPFSDGPGEQLVSLVADLLHAVLVGRLEQSDDMIAAWDAAVPKLTFPEAQARRAGWVLELGAYAVATRFLAQEPGRLLPVEVRLGTTVGQAGQNVDVEIDVAITSGPRLTSISCGIDQRRSVLSAKFFEARDRAKQLGGSESRSLTLVSRSGSARPRDRQRALDQIDAHRRVVDWTTDPERDRHALASPAEACTGLDPDAIRAVLLDPRSELCSGDANQQALARFLRSAIYR